MKFLKTIFKYDLTARTKFSLEKVERILANPRFGKDFWFVIEKIGNSFYEVTSNLTVGTGGEYSGESVKIFLTIKSFDLTKTEVQFKTRPWLDLIVFFIAMLISIICSLVFSESLKPILIVCPLVVVGFLWFRMLFRL